MADQTKIIFLGTNGWFDTETGDTTCVLIDAPSAYVILDAGNGIYKVDRYITEEKPIYLFLSHFHFDHITGLHILNKFKFVQGLTICCYKGGQEILDNLLKQPFTIPFADLPFKLLVKELTEGENRGFPFKLITKQTIHSTKCFAYRFSLDDKEISFCPDSGYSPALVELSKNADLVITECSWRPGQTKGVWPHLNPELAAQIAKEANAKQLALVHFDAENYKTFADRENAENKAREVFKNTLATRDDMVLTI